MRQRLYWVSGLVASVVLDEKKGYKPCFQLGAGRSPVVWSAIWLVSLARMALANISRLRLHQALKRLIRVNASAILFVSVSAAGADNEDEPKLDSNSAKKRFNT